MRLGCAATLRQFKSHDLIGKHGIELQLAAERLDIPKSLGGHRDVDTVRAISANTMYDSKLQPRRAAPNP